MARQKLRDYSRQIMRQASLPDDPDDVKEREETGRRRKAKGWPRCGLAGRAQAADGLLDGFCGGGSAGAIVEAERRTQVESEFAGASAVAGLLAEFMQAIDVDGDDGEMEVVGEQARAGLEGEELARF